MVPSASVWMIWLKVVPLNSQRGAVGISVHGDIDPGHDRASLLGRKAGAAVKKIPA